MSNPSETTLTDTSSDVPKSINPLPQVDKIFDLNCKNCGKLIGTFTRTALKLSPIVSTRNKFVGDCIQCGHRIHWYPTPNVTTNKH